MLHTPIVGYALWRILINFTLFHYRCESRVKPYDRITCMKPCLPTTTTPRSRTERPSGGITGNRERNEPFIVSRPSAQTTWAEGRWGPCSRSCGRGDKYRQVICRNNTGRLLPDSECSGVKPITRHGCKLRECPWKHYIVMSNHAGNYSWRVEARYQTRKRSRGDRQRNTLNERYLIGKARSIFL